MACASALDMAIAAMNDALASDEGDDEKSGTGDIRTSEFTSWTKCYEAYIAAKVCCG